ncbi:MAG: hypothetical protein L6262_06805 [Weeksellaceae bacterium]|nr:hypothetical protein [Weeksellaceae bacterium]
MQNLKSKYEQREIQVSDGLWDRLEEKLDQVPAKKEKTKMVWLKYAAVVLLMFGLGGSFWMINHKSDIRENQELANQTKNQISIPFEPEENNEVETINPINNNSENRNESENPSTPVRMTEKIGNGEQSSISDKEILIKKEEISIPQQEEKLTQNDAYTSLSPQKPKVKYVSSSDLLFGVEIDKAKSEMPKSAMGINMSKPKIESDFPNPKRIKLFGITLYDKDSITTK